MDPYLISCDWGSTSFRLRVVTAAGRRLAERKSAQGTSAVSEPGLSAEEREVRFSRVLAGELAELGDAYAALPVVVSGMATSAHGWVELPYAMAPLPLDGSGLVTAQREVAGHSVTLVSGVRTAHDVMRGEECELLGLLRSRPELAQENVLVLLPGTHAKHVCLSEGLLQGFSTAMTGELFALLKEHSVLRYSFVDSDDDSAPEHDADEVFCMGLRDGLQGSLLAALFQVRAKSLLDGAGASECTDYLNGALLGDELRGEDPTEWERILVCAPERRARQYRRAVEMIWPETPVLVIGEIELDRLVSSGHLAVLAQQDG